MAENTCVAAQAQAQEQARATVEQRMNHDVSPASQIQLISTETLQKLLSCCYRTAVEVGSRAGARIQIGKAVRWKVSRINDYLESICGGLDDE